MNQRHISDTQLHYAVESVVNGYNRLLARKKMEDDVSQLWGAGLFEQGASMAKKAAFSR